MFALGLTDALRSADPAAVIVRGTGMEIRQNELDESLAHHKAELLSQGRLLPDDAVGPLRTQLLDRLILIRLCAARATESDRQHARVESAGFIDRLRREHGDAGFRRLLANAGFRDTEFATNKFQEALVSTVIDREVKAEIIIPTADRRQYYEEHPDQWVEPASVRIAWLPLSWIDPLTGSALTPESERQKRSLALELRDRAGKGEDFAALVRAYSDDLKLRENRGEVRVMRGQVVSPIEEPAFRLEPGGVSGIIEVPGGIGILKVLERVPPHRMPWEQADPQINELIIQREFQLRIPEFVSRLRREAGLEVMAATPR